MLLCGGADTIATCSGMQSAFDGINQPVMLADQLGLLTVHRHERMERPAKAAELRELSPRGGESFPAPENVGGFTAKVSLFALLIF